MRNTLFLTLTAFGLGLSTVHAGSISAYTEEQQVTGDLAQVEIDTDELFEAVAFLEGFLTISTEDGVSTLSSKTDEDLEALMTITVTYEADSAIVTVTNLHRNETIVITYSDASEMPDVTTLQGLFLMLAQLKAINLSL